MAKIKVQTTASFGGSQKIRRPGVHSKTKTSQLKSSKIYKKKYKGQGRWNGKITKKKTSRI